MLRRWIDGGARDLIDIRTPDADIMQLLIGQCAKLPDGPTNAIEPQKVGKRHREDDSPEGQKQVRPIPAMAELVIGHHFVLS